jgi:hypothetical protein
VRCFAPILCAAFAALPAGSADAGDRRRDPPRPTTDAPALAELAWLAGSWEIRLPSGLVEEHWMQPRGASMIGMARTVQGDATVAFECLRIEEREDGLVYCAAPGGGAWTEFALAEVVDGAFVFSNPEHDFPQRIVYGPLVAERGAGADGERSFRARIEGQVDGTPQGQDFPYRAAAPDVALPCARGK